MPTDSPRASSPRRRGLWWTVLPGAAVMLVVIAGFISLTAREDGRESSLDGRHLAEFPVPEVTAVLDKSWMAGVDTWASEQLAGRATWLGIHAMSQHGALQDPIVDDVYLDGPDGFMFENHIDRSVPEDLHANAQQLSDELSERNIPLMWLYAPRKEEIKHEVLPEAWGNDLLVEKPHLLEALDTGDLMVDLTDGLGDPDIFNVAYFRTDHHWTADGALMAVDQASQAARDLGVDVPDDTRDFERIIHEDAPFYGTLARRVTAPVVPGKDWISWLQPVDGFSARQCLDTDCDAPLINTYRLEEDSQYASRFRVFLGGDVGYLRLINDDAPSDTTVLLLKDSYGNPFSMYLAERVKEVHVVDERHYTGELEMSELAEDVGADVVMILHNQVSLLGTSRFDSTSWVDVKGADTYEGE